MLKSIPRYADLDRPDQSHLPYVKGVFGADDQLGTLNHITPQKAVEASKLVRTGRRFNLDLPLHLPYSLMGKAEEQRRIAPKQTLYKPNNNGLLSRDDKLDDFFLQASSQWDGLTHYGDPTHGFYNGVPDEQVTQEEGTRNGIDRVAELCIYTRGVLADLPRFFEAVGVPWAPVGSYVCTAAHLADCLKWEGVAVTPGDVLLVRTGWLGHFLGAPAEAREAIFRERKYSGISGGEDMWEYLWDHHIAAVASDNVTVESIPRPPIGKANLHWAIARIGITIGEMFVLDELASAAAAQRRYDFLFASKPLNVRGGVGSPPNAMAVW